jgi:hypothetical protein
MNKPAQEEFSHPGRWSWQRINLVSPTAHELILLLADGKLTLGMWVDEEADAYWIDLFSGRPIRNVTHWAPLPPLPDRDPVDDRAATSFSFVYG